MGLTEAIEALRDGAKIGRQTREEVNEALEDTADLDDEEKIHRKIDDLGEQIHGLNKRLAELEEQSDTHSAKIAGINTNIDKLRDETGLEETDVKDAEGEENGE